MSTRSLFDAVIDPGIQNPNYFEGRLLTADALRADQRAHRERQLLLGRAIGAGVVEGLTVKLEPAGTGGIRKTITVKNGFAINADGETLLLKEDVTADVVPPTAIPEAPATLFTRCEESIEPQVPVGVGLYVLVMSPASAYRERAPKSGLGTEGTIIGCGARYAVDGVRFRLEPLRPEMISGTDASLRSQLTMLLQQTANMAKRSLLRNVVAHLCFGTLQRARFAADAFAREEGASALLEYGTLDDLSNLGRLTRCDVPLGLLLWNTSGIAFLDLWAVRRRPVPPPPSPDWPTPSGVRTRVEGEARFLQFQAHLDDLLNEVGVPPTIKAREYFRYLPSAGFLKLAGSSLKGVNATTFFEGAMVRYPRPPQFDGKAGPSFMDGARLETLLHLSFDYPPSDLSIQEAIWLYRVRENAMAIDAHTSGITAPVLVFHGGEMPYFGSPRFDVARWNYSNYSSALVGPGGF